ncbi:MAG: nucleolar RNA-binding Nop10p family protein [Nitrososphaerota archaeon]|nr:nucleolar RNA-binding Nop10p family protein [Nitrososphaerota archaeon]
MRRCERCGIYTLKPACPACNSPTLSPHPPQFREGSPVLEEMAESVLEKWRSQGLAVSGERSS